MFFGDGVVRDLNKLLSKDNMKSKKQSILSLKSVVTI